MARRAIVFALGLTASLGWGVGIGHADEDMTLARGFSPGKLYDYSGLDSINLYNGALSLEIPIGPRYPVGDQLSYGLTLSYSSNVWDATLIEEQGPALSLMTPRRSSDAGVGWTISLGGQLYGPTHPIGDPPHSAGFQWESEDGSSHVFYPSLHEGESGPCSFTRDGTYLRLCPTGAPGVRTIEFPDGTKRTFELVGNPPRNWDIDRYRLIRIEDRLGNWVEVSYSGGTWTITDSLDRLHTASFNLQMVDGENMWVLYRASLQGFNGATSIYDFITQTEQIHRSCKDNTTASDTLMVPLLKEVRLPLDESGARMSYTMPAYEAGQCAGVKDRPGTLKKLELPAGGALEWTYQPYVFKVPEWDDHRLEQVLDQSAGVLTKTLTGSALCGGGSACQWSYNPSRLGGGNRRTVMSTPVGDDHVFYFREERPDDDLPQFTGWDHGLAFTTAQTHAGLFLSQEIWEGPVDPTGQTMPVRSVYVAYEHDELRELTGQFGLRIGSQFWPRSNRRMTAQRTLYHDDENPGGGQPRFTAVAYDEFDGLGHYRERVASGDLGGSGTHTAYTDYNPDQGIYDLVPGTNDPIPGYVKFPDYPAPWVISIYESIQMEEPGSAIETQYCFDENTGRLERLRMLASAAGVGPNDVIVETEREFEVLNQGNPNEMQQITYLESVHGGDLQSVNANPALDLCNINLPATPVYWTRNTQIDGTLARTEPLVPGSGPQNPTTILRTLDLEIDRSTGLAKASTDPAGLTTDVEYDGLGRLTWLKPHGGGDAWTEIVYCAEGSQGPGCGDVAGDPAYVTVRRRTNGSETGAVLEESRTVFDPFGRIAREDRKIPGHGWTYAATVHNAMGWVTEVTERGSNSSNLPYKTLYRNHDPFGRPTEIRAPDYVSNPSHKIDVDYDGVRSVSRTVAVASTLSGGEILRTTEERYDHLGRLYRVREPSGPGGSVRNTDYSYDAAGRLVSVEMDDGSVTQSRSFSYDGRGFLLSETHPENGLTKYRLYDARGHAKRKTTGPDFGHFDLRFVHDQAERLTEVCEYGPGGCGKVYKEFIYGSGTSPSDRSKGKIKTAIRHNHVINPSTGASIIVTVEESYTYGGTGGRISQRLTELNTLQKFFQGWSYDGLGRATALFYPTCEDTQSICSGNGDPPDPEDRHQRTVDFDYDLGFLTAVPGFASQIDYHANGMLDQIQHSNGAIYGQGLDSHWMRRPGSLWIVHPSQNLSLVPELPGVAGTPLELYYSYDGAGNVKGWYDWHYRYDGVSRVLESAVVDPITGQVKDYQTYEFDVFGNILEISTRRGGDPPTEVAFGVDPATNRLSASTYDAAGNLRVRSDFSYGYDALSMMQTMNGGGNDRTYIYTADDERIWTVEAASSPWDETFTLRGLDGKVLRVFETNSGSADLAWAQDYVYRDGQLLATARTDGAGGETLHHFHLNHLGTPLLITNPQGGTEVHHSYFPFGEEQHPDNDTERMKFTGHERDLNQSGQADDLDYMHARYCSPLLGRFLSVDRAGANPRVPQTLNRYAYVANNPLNYVDPTGLEMQCHTIPDEEGKEQVVCADEITVEEEAPEVESEVRVEFELPVAMLDQPSGQEFRLNLFERAIVDIPIDGVEYGRCVRENRLDYWQAIAGSAVPKSLVPPGRVPNPRQPLTTPASVTAHGIRRAFPASPTAARAATGLRVTGRAVSRVATPLTIAEGYYDIGVLGYCGFAD